MYPSEKPWSPCQAHGSLQGGSPSIDYFTFCAPQPPPSTLAAAFLAKECVPNQKAPSIHRLGKGQERVQLENSTQQNGGMTDPIRSHTSNLTGRYTKLQSVVEKIKEGRRHTQGVEV